MDPDRAHAAFLATFAANVRERADELGMTLSDVAEKAGIPRATLHVILSARRTPTLITLVKIGGAIGSNVVELFLDAATPPKKKR
jgi:predicted transcriptional regulator